MTVLTLRHIHDWAYLTEGNAHIILQYVGSQAQMTGHILRLPKRKAQDGLPSTSAGNTFTNEFNQYVISTLLGSGFVDPMVEVQITAEFLKALKEKIYSERPLKRRADPFSYVPATAFLMKNWSLRYYPRDTWTFEIKPKWGFLPSSTLIDKRHQALKKTVCRFCMHQRLRRPLATTASMNYCPLDLYSGDPERMRRALTASLMHPHDYFKLFHNGKLISSTEWASYSSLLFGQSYLTEDESVSMLADLMVTILLGNPILQKLKQLQQSLDSLDIEGIYPLYEKHGEQPTHISHWISIVQQFLERQSSQCYSKTEKENSHDSNGSDDRNHPRIQPLDKQDEIQRLYEYVLSMTFKDCSVMISLTNDYEINNRDTAPTVQKTSRVTSSGQSFEYQVKVIDVDMKSWSKIPFWFDLDREIVKHNLQLEHHGRICLA